MQKLLIALLERLARRSVFFALYLHYLRGYKKGLRRKNFENHVQKTKQSNDRLIAVWDFSVWPYALGDILNWNICLCCQAINKGINKIDIVVIIDEKKPSPKMQSYIHGLNFERFFLDIYPAFHTNPLLNSIKTYKDRDAYERDMIDNTCERITCVPDAKFYVDAINKLQDPTAHISYVGEFSSINEFFKENGYIPKLKAFLGVESIGKSLKLGFPKNVFFVALHLRHRKSEQGTAAKVSTFARDVNFDIWIAFLKRAGKAYPQVRFLLLGNPEEVDRRVLNLTNVIFLKNHGYSLAGELSSIVEADLFIGSNSGPAMMAMMSDVPYLIFQAEAGQEYTARICDIQVGDDALQFAGPHQNIVWENQSADSIFTKFENKYLSLSKQMSPSEKSGDEPNMKITGSF